MRWALAPVGGALLFASCSPIEGTPRTTATINRCDDLSCDAYTGAIKPVCREGRCEVVVQPSEFTLVISLPTTSFFGAGSTFAVTSRQLANATDTEECNRSECISLQDLVRYSTEYRVTEEAANSVGYPQGPGIFSLPGTMTLTPLVESNGVFTEATSQGLPLPPLSKQGIIKLDDTRKKPVSIEFSANLAPGRYRRVITAAPPFDGAFPPLISEVEASGGALSDINVLGTSPLLDDPSGLSRVATIRRSGGLDGFQVWLEDEKTRIRVSPLRVLEGEQAQVRLDTVGVKQADSVALPDQIDIIVAPPEDAIAMPRLVNRLIGGAGLVQEYPRLPPPVAVSGRVDRVGLGAKVVFESSKINRLDAEASTFLSYVAEVFTDDSGRFSTVLPPGSYTAYAIPAFDTPLAQSKTQLEVTQSISNVVLSPEERSRVFGKVVLARTDGAIPLVSAEVIATPSDPAPSAPWKAPRSARAVTNSDGSFVLFADPGTFDIAVVPAAGSGFPVFVSTSRGIQPKGEGNELELSVPAPIRISYKIHDFNENVVRRAIVRAFALRGGTVPVEIGRAMTDAAGQFEMFLSP